MHRLLIPGRVLPFLVAGIFMVPVVAAGVGASATAGAAEAAAGGRHAQAPLIAIDVGHSLARSGAVGASGRPEFEFNRDLALAVDEDLRRHGFRTRLIGADGLMDKLTDRTALAAEAGADFFLSLHHDSVQPQYLETRRVGDRDRPYSDRFSGYSLFVSRKNPDLARSLACAEALGAGLRRDGFTPSLHHAEPIPGENRPLADPANGVYYFDDLVVLKTATMPAVLLEAGIIVNPSDERTLADPATRRRIAGDVVGALRDCLPDRP